MPEPMKQLNIPISKEMWRDLRQEALNRECSAAEIVRNALTFTLYGHAPAVDHRKVLSDAIRRTHEITYKDGE